MPPVRAEEGEREAIEVEAEEEGEREEEVRSKHKVAATRKRYAQWTGARYIIEARIFFIEEISIY